MVHPVTVQYNMSILAVSGESSTLIRFRELIDNERAAIEESSPKFALPFLVREARRRIQQHDAVSGNQLRKR